MYYYKIFGLHLASDLVFLQLIKGTECIADITIEEEPVTGQLPVHPPEQQYDFGETLSWLENRTCYLLVEHGRHITYQRKKGCDEMSLCTYILGWGLSMLALQRGELAIHCSAVSKDGDAVLICGESGCGKSTMTTLLLNRGYQLMADDMALAEYRGDQGVWAKPAFPYQKLCRDAALRSGFPMDEMIYIDEEKDKFLVPCKDIFDDAPRKVKAMIILRLTGSGSVQTQQLRGMDTFYACANNLFLRHLLKEKKYSPFIGEKCLKMASGIPMYVIGRPVGKDSLSEVSKQILQILDS